MSDPVRTGVYKAMFWQDKQARICAGWAMAGAGVAVVALAGCRGIPTQGERQARAHLAAVSSQYRPAGQRPVLPVLKAESGLREYLEFAMLKDPRVEAAYYDWAAAVERITRERSAPDPRLTFETDIADMVMTVMPGLMLDIPGPGKLRAAAAVAAAESSAQYFTFEQAVLESAYAVKKAYFQLYFLEEKIRVAGQTLDLLSDLERLARTQNEVGKVTLQDVLRAQIEQERLKTERANLEDSRLALRAQFKAALGLGANETEPLIPAQFESTPFTETGDLLGLAMSRNQRLKAMEAEVRRAEASVRLAYKARVPDFSLGLDADAYAMPTMYRPQFGMTLPIWRDKIAAEIAAAQAGKRAAEARFTGEQIALAVNFAEKAFLLREANRNVELLRDRLLPKAKQAAEVARSGYLAGRIDFFNLSDAQRMQLDFQLAEIEARTQRELLMAELSLVIMGMPPMEGAVRGGSMSGSAVRAPASRSAGAGEMQGRSGGGGAKAPGGGGKKSSGH